MSGTTGTNELARLGGKDLNNDGKIINLVVVGSSRYYDYSVIEEILDQWIELEGYPDIIIAGGASVSTILQNVGLITTTYPLLSFQKCGKNHAQDLKIQGEERPPLT